jgi:methenyltetrahydromethanopterin cyclohydrolase
MPAAMNLNARALQLCRSIIANADRLDIAVHRRESGATLVDCGVDAPGGQDAGLALARVCMADLAKIDVAPAGHGGWPEVRVETDQPMLACMASQYAGWEIKGEKYFAMGSGPMRAAAAREPLFADLGYRESPDACVGVLESGKLPGDDVCRDIAAKCRIEPANLTLLVAPTKSPAGTLQIVARSVETALHKLHELKFDLRRIERGSGSAPLPLPARDDMAAIGRTNDAILYGGRVTLCLHGDDATIAEVGARLPSTASPDYGRPFGEILAAYDHNFYKVDPLLFSPAQATLVNLDTGNTFQFGRLNPEVLAKSFG